jgi:hypothetical protein
MSQRNLLQKSLPFIPPHPKKKTHNTIYITSAQGSQRARDVNAQRLLLLLPLKDENTKKK